MGDEEYLLCVYWGEQTTSSVQVACWLCKASLALSAGNERVASGMKPLCMHCLSQYRKSEVFFAGGLMQGKKYNDSAEALEAVIQFRKEKHERN